MDKILTVAESNNWLFKMTGLTPSEVLSTHNITRTEESIIAIWKSHELLRACYQDQTTEREMAEIYATDLKSDLLTVIEIVRTVCKDYPHIVQQTLSNVHAIKLENK